MSMRCLACKLTTQVTKDFGYTILRCSCRIAIGTKKGINFTVKHGGDDYFVLERPFHTFVIPPFKPLKQELN